jgi:hypothetical protein
VYLPITPPGQLKERRKKIPHIAGI